MYVFFPLFTHCKRSSPVTFISFLLWSANQKTMTERPIKGRALSYLRDDTFSFIHAPWISSLFGIGISFFTGLGPCLPNNLSTYGVRRFHISRSEWDRVFSLLTVVPLFIFLSYWWTRRKRSLSLLDFVTRPRLRVLSLDPSPPVEAS